jgi:hypothetical protein
VSGRGGLAPESAGILEATERLEEIREEMLELLSEAEEVARQTAKAAGQRVIYERAAAYWIPQIKIALKNDHGYLGSSMCSLEDTIKDLDELLELEEEEG